MMISDKNTILSEHNDTAKIFVNHLSKVYPGHTAVEDITFQVKTNSIHGFLGKNGAGKTTTLKMIAGLVQPSSGYIHFGEQTNNKYRVGCLLEDNPLYENMSVYSFLHFMRKLYRNTDKAVVDYALKAAGLVSVKERFIAHLSKGYRQRVGLAQALTCPSDILILDEPTSGLDPSSVVEFRELIKNLKSEKTIIFSSHILSEVEALCDDVTIIDQGKILASGPVNEIYQLISHQAIFCVELEIKGQSLKEEISGFLKEKMPSFHFVGQDRYMLNYYEEKNSRFNQSFIKFLIDKEINVYQFFEEKSDLEDVFLSLTNHRGGRL